MAGWFAISASAAHSNPSVQIEALNRFPFDSVLCAVSALDHFILSFAEEFLPVANARGVAIIGMKVMGLGVLAPFYEKALRYTLGLPISTAIVGMETMEQLEKNLSVGDYLLGFLAAILIGGLIAALHGFLSITLGGDQVVNGMGIWILGFGMTAYIGYPYTGPLGMERIPDVAGLSPFFFLAIGLVVLTWWIFSKTTLGLQIRSAGESPSVTEVSGINVTRTRYLSVIVSGMLMGLAGAVYSLDYNPVWSVNFLLGWGFIALALVFFSMWNPLILFCGSILLSNPKTAWLLVCGPTNAAVINIIA